ncbi:MAG: hypothetical protein QOF48_1159 [Verrucomicrobiota bacterium]|jgi:hypothetical protein
MEFGAGPAVGGLKTRRRMAGRLNANDEPDATLLSTRGRVSWWKALPVKLM